MMQEEKKESGICTLPVCAKSTYPAAVKRLRALF
jgi:hypothetical protein